MLRWNFDPAYSTVEFAIRNLWYTVHGRFRVVEGSIALDQEDLRRSCVDATIKASSIDTGNKRRDAHLQSRDFLDTEKFPDIRFRSTKVERGKDRDSIDLEGDLTINDKTRSIALAVNEMDRSRSPRGEEYIYYSATAEIDRFDFGIDYGRTIIGRKLKVTINIQASA
ncbi:MAG TPA: YceI family protein [Pyrinomonadaceae bacterium]|nr:YceI family protein [Pyrinomonadaceae bacterium]